MESQLQAFKFEGSNVRTVTINDEAYFVAADVTSILGLTNTTVALSRLDDDERSKFNLGRQGEANVVNEYGLYELIIASRKPEAHKFKRWITHDVLPTIRKHGAYMTPAKIEEVLTDPDTIIKLATQLKQEREGRLLAEHRNIMNRPKVLFADAVSVSDTPILIGELAKILKQNGVETLKVDGKTLAMGPNNLFKWMRANGYLINRKGTDYNTPTQKAMKLKLFRIKESTHVSGDGVVKITKTSKVTGKGQQYFVNKFLGTVTKGLEVSGNESK